MPEAKNEDWVVLRLAEAGGPLLTRDQGEVIRQRIFALLDTAKGVEVLFDGVPSYTPSFVDELLGKALQEMGRKAFRERIRLSTTSTEVRHLVNLVLTNRTRMPRTTA